MSGTRLHDPARGERAQSALNGTRARVVAGHQLANGRQPVARSAGGRLALEVAGDGVQGVTVWHAVAEAIAQTAPGATVVVYGASAGEADAPEAGLVPEPTRLDLWIATRGLLHGTLAVPGRSAHAEVNQPSWQRGGGVNAIERTLPLLAALARLNAKWAERPDKQHPLLGTPRVQPTMITGGTFVSNLPESCTVKLNATYLPTDADDDGYGARPRDEIVAAVSAAAAPDDWLGEQPPSWSWSTDYPSSEIKDEPIIAAAAAAARAIGAQGRVLGIDTTYDGALLARFAGTPSPAFGPGDLARAHAPDEWIGQDELLLGARAYVGAIVAWCGVTGRPARRRARTSESTPR